MPLTPPVAGASSRLGSGILTPSFDLPPKDMSCLSSVEAEKRKMPSVSLLEPPTKRICSKETLVSTTKKQIRVPHPAEELLKHTIFVTPHPPNVLVPPRNLQPLLLLLREHVPLSFLDLSNPLGEFTTSRFVESHVKVLELEGRLGCRPIALVAISELTRKMYTLERHSNSLYAVCKLGSWVDLENLSCRAIACCHQALRILMTNPVTGSQSFALPHTTPQDYCEEKERQRAIQELKALHARPSRRQTSLSFDRKTPMRDHPNKSNSVKGEKSGSTRPSTPIPSTESQPVLPPRVQTQDETQTPSLEAPFQSANDNVERPCAAEICGNIRAQYIDTLYRSKGSVAYFVKGPLSRARAAYHLDLDSNLNMDDLIDFLKGLVMTTVLIDKKYRNTIPELVSSMKTLIESSDDEISKPRKKRTKKTKVGKNGLYTHEDDQVRAWWRSIMEVRKFQLAEDETISNEEIKYHIENLRTRETLLQIIIILEILALEPLRSSNANESQLPGLPSEELPEKPPEAAPKKRNKHNLPLLLDVHADRLCIWQSTAIQVPALIGDTRFSGLSPSSQRHGTTGSDPLRDFCTDVIVPFFAARLRERSHALSKRLGGPSIIATPPRPKAKKPPAAKATIRPHSSASTANKRCLPRLSTDSLESVLSKDRARRSMSRGSADALAALRAATIPVAPKLKREGSSDPNPLKSIPLLQERSGKSRAKKRGVTIFGYGKLQKEAMVEAELRDAITGIKRPNRELAGKLLACESERRSLSQLRKGRKSTRTLLHHQVQVKATPANFRYKDVLVTDSSCNSVPRLDLPCMLEDDTIQPSFLISSAPCQGDGDKESFFKTKVTATPLKKSGNGPVGLPPLSREDLIPSSSPLAARKNKPSGPRARKLGMDDDRLIAAVPSTPRTPSPREALLETPLRNHTSREIEPTAAAAAVMAATPVQRSALMPPPRNHAAITPATPTGEGPEAPATTKESVSIFKTLGWDEDDDL